MLYLYLIGGSRESEHLPLSKLKKQNKEDEKQQPKKLFYGPLLFYNSWITILFITHTCCMKLIDIHVFCFIVLLLNK